jgi:hypothetical protein
VRNPGRLAALALLPASAFGLALYQDRATSSASPDIELAAPEIAASTGDDSVDAFEGPPPEPAPECPAVDQLLGRAPAELGPLLADVRFGMPPAAVEALPGVQSAWEVATGCPFGGVSLSFGLERDALASVMLSAESPNTLRAILRERWGEPRPLPGGYQLWVDAAAHQRALLGAPDGEETRFWFAPYLTAEQLLGDRPDRLGFETTPIFGARPEALLAAHPGRAELDGDPPNLLLRLPALEETRSVYTLLEVGFDRQRRADRISLELDVDGENPALRAALVRALTAKLGAPSGEADRLVFGAAPRAELTANRLTLHR